MRASIAVVGLTIAATLATLPEARAVAPPSPTTGIAAMSAAQGIGGYLAAAAAAVGVMVETPAKHVDDPLANLIAAATHGDKLRRAAVAQVSPDQWVRVARANDAIGRLFDPHGIASVDDIEFDQAALDELRAAADLPIDHDTMWQAAATVAAAIDELRAALADGYVLTSSTEPTPLGDIIIDAGPAPCDSTYSAPAFIVIDTCGNDIYSAPAGGADGLSAVPTAIVLDTDGNDIAHEAFDKPSVGAAINGGLAVFVDETGNDRWGTGTGSLIGGVGTAGAFGFMVDLAGDDVYSAEGFLAPGGKFGAGQLAGTGILVDVAGNDSYFADTFQQGSGWFGDAVGILADLEGNDRYVDISTYAQGSGGVGGLGVLYDGAGDDFYEAGSVFEQGGAACGGIGVLVDASGDDNYREFSWFSQGAAATGLAATGCGDEAGEGLADRALDLLPHEARGIVPAAIIAALNGLPIGAVGVLADLSGNDVYEASSYMQGSSVGSAAGLLLDGGGNDRYSAHSCAQAFGAAGGELCGAGGQNAPGVAALVDAAGDDTYQLGFGLSGQGAGYGGSVVVLLDGGGKDSYTSGVTDGGGFQKRGDNGLAIDLLPMPDDPRDYELPGAPNPPSLPSLPPLDPNNPPSLDDLPGPGAAGWAGLFVRDNTTVVYAYAYPDGSAEAHRYDLRTGEFHSAFGSDVSFMVDSTSLAATLAASFGDACTLGLGYAGTGERVRGAWGSFSYGDAAGQLCLEPRAFEGYVYWYPAG